MPLRTLVDEKLHARASMQGSAKVIFEGQIVQAETCDWQGKPRPVSRCDYFDVKRIEAFELEHSVGH